MASSSDRVRTMLKRGRQLVAALEGTVDDAPRARGKCDPHTFRARAETFSSEKVPCLRKLAEQPAHTPDQLWRRNRARLPVRVGLVHDDEPHARQLRLGVAFDAVKNSTTAGVRTSGFTLCVCPASSLCCAPGMTSAIARAASFSL